MRRISLLFLLMATCGVASEATPAFASGAGAAHGGRSEPMLTTRELLSLRDIGGYYGAMSVSPGGRYVAFQLQEPDFASNTYRVEWYVSSTAPHSVPRRVADGGSLMLAQAPFGRVDGARADVVARWSPDERWIAYLRRDGDQVQVWRARADGSRVQQVTHAPGNVLRFAWQRDGRGIFFLVGRGRAEMAREAREEGERGYLVDDRFMPGADSTRPLWFSCGEDPWHVPLPASERCSPRLWAVEFGSPEHEATGPEVRAFRELTASERPPGIGASRVIEAVSWSAHHTHAAWLENVSPRQFRGFAAPVTLFADDQRCGAPECTGSLAGVWWRGADVLFLEHEGWAGSVPVLYRWRPGARRVRRLFGVDGTLRSCAMAIDHLLCLLETPKAPRKIVSIDAGDGRVATVFDPNPGFTRYALGRVQKLEVTDRFGNQAFGHLVYPPEYDPHRRYPLVIVQYRSRGFLRGGTGEEYPIYPLAAAGFLVYSSDNPEDRRIDAHYAANDWKAMIAVSDREYGRSDYRAQRTLSAFDEVLDELECRGIVDPSRVGITGLSAGAEVLYYSLIHSTRFAAAASSGLAAPEAGWLLVNDTVRAIFEAQWDARTLPEAIETASGLLSFAKNLNRVRAPLLLQVPDDELVVDLPEYVALRDAGRPVEAYVFPGEYHIKYRPLHKLAAGERVIDWFRFWLQGVQDPSPQKAQQYARWRALRQEAARLSDRSRTVPRFPPRCRRGAAGAEPASARGDEE